MDQLNFKLDFKEKPVTINDEDYMLVELTGKARDKYLNNVGARIRHGKDGNPQGVKNFEGLQAGLVSQSLFKLEDNERKPVKVETIQAWPSSVLTGLHDAAKKLSALGDEEGEGDDEEGNDD